MVSEQKWNMDGRRYKKIIILAKFIEVDNYGVIIWEYLYP